MEEVKFSSFASFIFMSVTELTLSFSPRLRHPLPGNDNPVKNQTTTDFPYLFPPLSFFNYKNTLANYKIQLLCKKNIVMKTLTRKEEEIMGFFWKEGPLFVKQMLDFYDEPRPHFNTLSTIVRALEEKGYVGHRTYGNTYQYYAVVSKEDFKQKTLRGVISKYFNNSYLDVVSSLVKEEDFSLEELKKLIREVEDANK